MVIIFNRKEENRMEQINTNKKYNEYVKQKSPNSPILKDCFNAFWVGGLICSIGQIILDFCMFKGMDNTMDCSINFVNRNFCYFNSIECV